MKTSAPDLHEVYILMNFHIQGILHYIDNVGAIINYLHAVQNSLNVIVHFNLQNIHCTINNQDKFRVQYGKVMSYYMKNSLNAYRKQ